MLLFHPVHLVLPEIKMKISPGSPTLNGLEILGMYENMAYGVIRVQAGSRRSNSGADLVADPILY